MFFTAPSGNFDGNDNLVDLTGATVWETSPFTLPSGSYRLSASQSISPAFTPSGGNAVIGGFVSGNATRTFLIAPAENFNANDNLTTLSGCVLSQSQNVTGLVSAVPYRALALTRASDVFEVIASDIPLRTFYDYDGVRATFDTPVPVQFSADGSPVVISDRPVALVSGAPSLTQVAPLNGLTYVSQGAMLAPILAPAIQGWDEWLAFSPKRADGVTNLYKAQIPYGNNVNPGATGSPVVFAEGSHGAYIQSIWGKYDDKYSIARYIPLVTVVPAPLPPGSFRPGIANGGAARTNYGANASDINMTVLRNITRPSSARTIQTITGYLGQQRLRPVWAAFGATGGETDERKRRLETCVHGDYGQDYGGELAADLLALHWTETDEAKMPMVLATIQRAIDLRSILDQGYLYNVGAGQSANGWVELVYAGFLLGDTTFLDAALIMKTNTTWQNFNPIPEELIGRNMPWPADIGSTNINYVQPWYLEHEWAWLSALHSASSSKLLGGYFLGNDSMTVMEVLAVMALQNGPDGMNGEDWLIASGYGHLASIMDDRIAMPFSIGQSSARLTPANRSAYAAVRPVIGSPTSGRPLQTGDGINTAIAGGFRSNFTTGSWCRSPITDRQSRLSLDKRWGPTWSGRSPTTQDTTTGVLVGVAHWEQSRSVSAAGPGLWTIIHRSNAEGTKDAFPASLLDPKITPIGTPLTAIAVNSHAPRVLIRPYSAHALHRLEEFSGPLPLHTRQLIGGVGYWFGGGAPDSFNYKWQEYLAGAWTDIAGTPGNVTLAEIDGMTWGVIDTRTVRSKDVRFGAQAVNASGTTAWAYSAAVTVPARTEIRDYLTADPAWPLKDVTYRYQSVASPFSLRLSAEPKQYPGYLLSIPNTADAVAPRIVTIDQLPVLGDLSSVPEGDLLVSWSRGLIDSGVTRATLHFYTSGDDVASLNGFALEYISDGFGWKHQFHRITGGVYSELYPGSYRDASVSGPAFNKLDAPSPGVFTRLNFSLVGGNLLLRAKSWARFNVLESFYDEPAAWQDQHTTTGALPAPGRIGFGTRASKRDIRVMGIGVSIDPAVPSLMRPEIPAYDYIA